MYEDINYYSLFNIVESGDGIGISESSSRTSPPPSHHSDDYGRSSGFYIYGNNRHGNRSNTSQCLAYNHGGLNIANPRFSH